MTEKILSRIKTLSNALALNNISLPNIISQVQNDKKILILIHPDCFVEKMLAKNDISEFNNYIARVENVLKSNQYEDVITELFYSDGFQIDNPELNDMYLKFRELLKKESGITFYRWETRFTNKSRNEFMYVLEDYFKKGYTFCMSGGYKELCLKDAIKAFEYVFGFVPETISELEFKREIHLSMLPDR